MDYLHRSVYIYELPPTVVVQHQSTDPQGFIAQALRESIVASPFHTTSAESASFFLIPIAFPAMGRGRLAVAAVLTYLRHRHPYFNASLAQSEPNHLVVYGNDLAMDVPPGKRYPKEPLPPEIDVSRGVFEKQRWFVALTLTGNTEAGFRPGRDVVLPPSHRLKSGPDEEVDQCCRDDGGDGPQPSLWLRLHPKLAGRCRVAAADSSRCCKPVPRRLADSPWAPLRELAERPWRASWAGQASGGGMGRHGGSGPRVRRWLREAADALLAHGVLVTDSNSEEHLRRNVRLAPRMPGLFSPGGRGQRGGRRALPAGLLVPGAESKRALACISPYGRGNGWEGRSAAALRDGCMPLTVQPPRAGLPLDEWVPSDGWSELASALLPAPGASEGLRPRAPPRQLGRLAVASGARLSLRLRW